MNRVLMITLVFLLAVPVYADDPGARDSLIIETVYAELGDSTVDVRIYATTDDSVYFYNLPITWNSSSGADIYPIGVSYHNLLIYWMDNYDTLLYDQILLRMLGWCGDHGEPPLITNNQRMHCWTLHFSVDSLDLSQYVGIDTTFDYIHGSLLFGLGDGYTSFAPVFIPGAIYYGITTEADENNPVLPQGFSLLQNYPNPFNTSTTIEFTLPEAADVQLSVYNILGQKTIVIFEGIKPAGAHSMKWNAGDLPSGVYFARLGAREFTQSIKMILLK
jgi:hypothetical protein